jgi:hypothetical protein
VRFPALKRLFPSSLWDTAIGGKDDLIWTAIPVGCDIDVVGVFGHVKCGFEDCEEGALGWAQAEGDEG